MMVQIRHNFDDIGRQLGNLIAQYADAVGRDIDREMGRLSAKLDGKLKEYTPVDTGILRAGWGSRRIGFAHYEHFNHVPYGPVVNYGGYRGVGPKTHYEGPQILPGGIAVGGGIFANQRPSHMVERAISDLTVEMNQTLTQVLKR